MIKLNKNTLSLRKIASCFLFIAAFGANNVLAQIEKPTDVGIAIKPTVFDFHIDKGKTFVQPVTIINSQDVPVQLKFYINDWLRDSVGDHKYFESGTLPVSCAPWIKISKPFIEVPPKTTATFDMTITIPDNDSAIQEMRWAMLFVEFVEEATVPKMGANKVATNMVRKQRIGLHIYETPPSVTGKDFKMLAFQPLDTKKNIYRMVCENTGHLQVQCKPYLELTAEDESGKIIRVESREFPMFPGQVRVVDVTIPKETPKGKYNTVAAIDAGEDIPLEAAQAEITVN